MTYLAQKFINQRDGGRAIDVVVAVHHDLLTVADGPLHPFDRLVHILHQERVVQVRKLGLKNFLAFSNVSMPLCTSRLARTGEMPVAAAIAATASGFP